MLERTSRFVLEVLPYLLSALIAAVVVPGFLYSQAHGTKAAAIPNVPAGVENALEMIQWDHAAFVPDSMMSDRAARPARDKLAYR
jgi:branched-subunit amino acid transport protein